jgi:uncharacterized protein YjbK
MKQFILGLTLIIMLCYPSYAEVESDGFNIKTHYIATKAFDYHDKKIDSLIEYLDNNFEPTTKGTITAGEMTNITLSYDAEQENFVKVITQININTDQGTSTVTIKGTMEFINSIRALLK